ncbi:ABC transporter permease [Xanthomonas albilineans]|uniref:ABC transporter permease n=1 Tax=Xanthomonas albilineans TaxID=29447 RepID=UPI0005F31770|nr:ABC transporter permease [Xanthomonas albilineans]
MTVALPLVFMVIYSFAYFVNAAPPTVVVGVSSDAQVDMADHFKQIPSDMLQVVPSEKHAGELLATGAAQVAFDRDPATHKVTAYAAPGYMPLARILAWTLAGAGTGRQGMMAVSQIKDPRAPLSFLPSILLMSILNLALFTTGVKLLEERAQGTLRLFRMLPSPSSYFFYAELLTKLVLGIVQSIGFIALSVAITNTGLSMAACGAMLALCAFVTVVLLPLGLLLGSILKSFSNGVHVFTIINMFVMFFGDLFFPASSFAATKPIALLIPTTYASDLMRHAVLGSDLHFPWQWSCSYMVVFALACSAACIRFFRYTAAR